VIQERESLATAGVCSVAFHYDEHNGKLIGEPYITSQGFLNFDVSQDLWEGARQQVRNTLKSAQPGTTAASIESAVNKVLSNYFYQQVRNRPNMLVTALPA
jgi:mRNA degradation ribonuclease J1/J2